MTVLETPDPATRNWRTGEPSAMRIYHHSPQNRRYGATHDSVMLFATEVWQTESNRSRILGTYRMMRTAGVSPGTARLAVYELLFAATITESVRYVTTDGEQR